MVDEVVTAGAADTEETAAQATAPAMAGVAATAARA
jgi:hypothetical protein